MDLMNICKDCLIDVELWNAHIEHATIEGLYSFLDDLFVEPI